MGPSPGWRRIAAGCLLGAVWFAASGPVAADTEDVVMLDPGHGGSDPGWVAPGGVPEKAAVLEFARRLRRALADRGHAADLTRTQDRLPTQQVRLSEVNARSCRALLSLHLSRDERLHLFVQRPVRDEALTRAVEELVAAGGRATPLPFAQNRHLRQSRRLADLLAEAWQQAHPGAPPALICETDVSFLRGVAAPAVLVELPWRAGPGAEDPAATAPDGEGLVRGLQRFLAEGG